MFKTAGLPFKPKKCRFAYDGLKFLGHFLNNEGVRPDSMKRRAVAAFSPPSDKRAIRRCLGICAYYRRFLQDFAKLSAPLAHLTKGAVKFQGRKEQQRAFDEVKRRLQTPLTLGYFDQLAEMEIHTDASNTIGEVLVQRHEGTERVIAYASRALPKVECNFSKTEK